MGYVRPIFGYRRLDEAIFELQMLFIRQLDCNWRQERQLAAIGVKKRLSP